MGLILLNFSEIFNNNFRSHITSYSADPISLSLAYSASARSKTFVPEENLSYGFRKTPINQRIVKKIVKIPEEKLYLNNKPVIELKTETVSKNCGCIEDEKIINPEYLRYNQIGYGPVKHYETKFESYKVKDEQLTTSGEDIKIESDCEDCGFQPGAIVDEEIPVEECGCANSIQATLRSL